MRYARIVALLATGLLLGIHTLAAQPTDGVPQYPNMPESGNAATPGWMDCAFEPLGEPYVHVRNAEAFPVEEMAGDPQGYVHYTDPCGLRLTNLSGVWIAPGVQLVVDHDPRSGRFQARRMYVAPDEEPRKTWNIGLGDIQYEGRLSREEIRIDNIGRFPPEAFDRCPDQAITREPSLSIELNASAPELGLRIILAWRRLSITYGDCAVTFMEINRAVFWRLDLED